MARLFCSSALPCSTRRQYSEIIVPALAYPPPNTTSKTHAIIISIGSGDPTEPVLHGVTGDFPFVLDELTARASGTIQVITDLQRPKLDPKVQLLGPNVQNIKDSIEKVGQAMKPDGLCYVYVAGHAVQDSPETAFMPLPSGGRLDGRDLVDWLKAAGSNGGTFVVMADVCFAAGFIRLPFVGDVRDGSLSWSKSGEKEAQGKNGQVIALLSTDYDQLGVTIDNRNKGSYPGYHGLFTWALFNFLRDQPLEVELIKLLPHLRRHSNFHPSKPRPQISATAESFKKLPIGRS